MCGAGRNKTVVKMSNKTPNGGCECVKLRGIERIRVFSVTKLSQCVLPKAHLAHIVHVEHIPSRIRRIPGHLMRRGSQLCALS